MASAPYLLLVAGIELALYMLIDGSLRKAGWDWLATLWQAAFFLAFGYQATASLSALSAAASAASSYDGSEELTGPTPTRRGRRRRGSVGTGAGAGAVQESASAGAAATAAAGQPAAPATPPLLVEAVLKSLEASRLEGAVQFTRFKYIFPYTFEQVSDALSQKYKPPKDPLNPSIVALRVTRDEALPPAAAPAHAEVLAAVGGDVAAAVAGCADGGARVRVREIESALGPWVPAWTMRLAGLPSSLTLLETTTAWPAQRAIRLQLINRELQSHGILQEGSVYYACPDGTPHCVYECCLDLKAVSTMTRTLLNTLMASKGSGPGARKADDLLKAHLDHMRARLKELYGPR